MNIYIGNLSFEMTEEDLRNTFLPFGQVTNVRIMNDKYIGSGQARGYGFVVMPSENEGENAVAKLNGTMLKDRMVNVVKAMPLSYREGNDSHGEKVINKRSSKVRTR